MLAYHPVMGLMAAFLAALFRYQAWRRMQLMAL